jgi:hypothetical protein
MVSETGVLPWWGERWYKAVFIAFLACWSGYFVWFLSSGHLPLWTENVVLAIALLSSLVTLGRQQPPQNIVLILLVVGALVTLGLAWLQREFHLSSTLFWTAIIINARGAAQFLARPCRGKKHYGWVLLGIAALLVALGAIILYKKIWLAGIIGLASGVIFLVTLPLFMNKRPVEPPVSWQPIAVLAALLAWMFLPRH